MEVEAFRMVYILALLLVVFSILLFVKVKQDKKNMIILRMNDKYPNLNEFVVAIKYELERQGKEVVYSGKGHFIIDGINYVIKERKKIIADGDSMQLTILKPFKST